MMFPRIFTQELVECSDVSLTGGKGASLGRLIRAGFPVPDGFVVNTRAWRLARE
jgi:pyruvate,water dikinase